MQGGKKIQGFFVEVCTLYFLTCVLFPDLDRMALEEGPLGLWLWM
jgi:hypothetical protein